MKRIYRSEDNKMVAGICGGLAEVTNIDPSLFRLGVIFVGLVTGLLPLLLTYLIGWLIIPYKSDIQ